MENRKITAAQLSASSQWDGYHSPDRARLFNQPNGMFVPAWSTAKNNQYQWIQIDLRIKTRVTHVATQGRAQSTQRITNYQLHFSDDGSAFSGFKQQGDSVTKVGQADHFKPRHHRGASPLCNNSSRDNSLLMNF